MAVQINRTPTRDWYANEKRKQDAPRGVLTEAYTEVLAQICLAWSVKYGTPLTWEKILNYNTDGNPTLIYPRSSTRTRGRVSPKMDWHKPISDLMVIPTARSLGARGQSQFAIDLLNFAMDPAATGLTWLEAQANNLHKIRRIFGITANHKSYNDKLYGGTGRPEDPYRAYINTRTGVNNDKWNPADIWVMTDEGRKQMAKFNRRRPAADLTALNDFLAQQFESRDIIPISLKKPQSTFHYDVVNTNHYVQRIVLGSGNNPTIEFTDGNRDMKINFTVQTVKLPKGLKTADARRNPTLIPSNAPVKNEKHIRLKYTVDGNQLELEYSQTGGGSYAKAQMGKIGAGNVKEIINNTTRLGVQRLQTIQMRYVNSKFTDDYTSQEKSFGIKASEWYNLKQLGGGKPRRNDNISNDNRELHNLFSSYLTEIWEAINRAGNANGPAPDFAGRFGTSDGDGLTNSKAYWSKARAGEVGLAIGGISQERFRKRTVQNLYEAAASIAFGSGLNQQEKQEAIALGDTSRWMKSTNRVSFEAGPYVKVY